LMITIILFSSARIDPNETVLSMYKKPLPVTNLNLKPLLSDEDYDCTSEFWRCVRGCCSNCSTCLQGCREWYCQCWAQYGKPCPGGNPGIIYTGGVMQISHSITFQVGMGNSTTGEYEPFASPSSTISSININVEGVDTNYDKSSPINIGAASFNSVTGYYEVTIPANYLSALAAYPYIEIDTKIKDPTIPSWYPLCNTPGEFTDIVFYPLSD